MEKEKKKVMAKRERNEMGNNVQVWTVGKRKKMGDRAKKSQPAQQISKSKGGEGGNLLKNCTPHERKSDDPA